MTTPPQLALVVIAGPQASGKSTVATTFADEARKLGERVALVELDQIAQMALPTLPDWDVAHRIFESVTGQWARSALTCVIAEGSGTHAEVSRLVEQAPASAVVVTIVTTARFDVAFERADADPTRGVSKEFAFLRDVYEHWQDEIARIDADLIISTSDMTVQQSVEQIRAAVDRARTRHH